MNLTLARTGARWKTTTSSRVELKREQTGDETIVQAMRYMTWVEENPCKPGETVEGMIVAGSVDERMRYALKRAMDVSVFVYEVAFPLKPAW